jgi:peptidylprolyl isomerase
MRLNFKFLLVFILSLPALALAANSIPAPQHVAKPPANAKKTPSGLAYLVLKPGHGKRHPKLSDTVKVNYTGWTTDGKMFDSSVARGQPATFPVGGVIKGWQQALQLMTVGEKARFWIPAKLAYGQHPPDGAPAGMLVFNIKLLKIAH